MTAIDGTDTRRLARKIAVTLAAVAFGACGGAPTSPLSPPAAINPATTPPWGPFAFTAAPIDVYHRSGVLQMGLRWGGQIVPHVGFNGWTSFSVYAPALGVLRSVTPAEPRGVRLDFDGADGVRFYLTPVEDQTLSLGAEVTAGQLVARRLRDASGRPSGVSLGLLRSTPRFSFINPARYPQDILYADDPVAHFSDTLLATLRPLLLPSTAGQLSWDLPGTLQGLWFLPSVPEADSLSSRYFADRLWFFYTHYDADFSHAGNPVPVLRAVFPAPAPDQGYMNRTLPSGNPLPRDITVSATPTLFVMEPEVPGAKPVVLLVQMLDNNTVRAETFDTYHVPNPQAFTENAKIYIR